MEDYLDVSETTEKPEIQIDKRILEQTAKRKPMRDIDQWKRAWDNVIPDDPLYAACDKVFDEESQGTKS